MYSYFTSSIYILYRACSDDIAKVLKRAKIHFSTLFSMHIFFEGYNSAVHDAHVTININIS